MIRDHYQKADKIPMGPANYDTEELKLQAGKRKVKPTHYIFALDESGSMVGRRW